MVNSWIQHVKKYASDNNLSYSEAMKQAKPTYGGSQKSGYIKKLIFKDGMFNFEKIKKPSKWIDENLGNKKRIKDYEERLNKLRNIRYDQVKYREHHKKQYGKQPSYAKNDYYKPSMLKAEYKKVLDILKEYTDKPYPPYPTDKEIFEQIK